MNETSRAGLVGVTPGMANVLGRTRLSDRQCSGCGMAFPVYPGRYPSACPRCGGAVERAKMTEGKQEQDKKKADLRAAFPNDAALVQSYIDDAEDTFPLSNWEQKSLAFFIKDFQLYKDTLSDMTEEGGALSRNLQALRAACIALADAIDELKPDMDLAHLPPQLEKVGMLRTVARRAPSVPGLELYLPAIAGWAVRSQHPGLERLGRAALTALAAAKEHPLVEAVVAPPGDNKGIGRAEMPQIDDPEAFVAFLRERGIVVIPAQATVKLLRATQGELDDEKVSKLKDAPEDARRKPIITSQDGWIIDGHHRWAACYELGPDGMMDTLQVQLGVDELLDLAREWPGAKARGIKEAREVLLRDDDANRAQRAALDRLVKLYGGVYSGADKGDVVTFPTDGKRARFLDAVYDEELSWLVDELGDDDDGDDELTEELAKVLAEMPGTARVAVAVAAKFPGAKFPLFKLVPWVDDVQNGREPEGAPPEVAAAIKAAIIGVPLLTEATLAELVSRATRLGGSMTEHPPAYVFRFPNDAAAERFAEEIDEEDGVVTDYFGAGGDPREVIVHRRELTESVTEAYQPVLRFPSANDAREFWDYAKRMLPGADQAFLRTPPKDRLIWLSAPLGAADHLEGEASSWGGELINAQTESELPVVAVSLVPRLQALIEAGTEGGGPWLGNPRNSRPRTLPLERLAELVPGGAEGLGLFLEGGVGGRFFRLEGPRDPVLVFELGERALVMYATQAPESVLGSDPRAGLVVPEALSEETDLTGDFRLLPGEERLIRNILGLRDVKTAGRELQRDDAKRAAEMVRNDVELRMVLRVEAIRTIEALEKRLALRLYEGRVENIRALIKLVRGMMDDLECSADEAGENIWQNASDDKPAEYFHGTPLASVTLAELEALLKDAVAGVKHGATESLAEGAVPTKDDIFAAIPAAWPLLDVEPRDGGGLAIKFDQGRYAEMAADIIRKKWPAVSVWFGQSKNGRPVVMVDPPLRESGDDDYQAALRVYSEDPNDGGVLLRLLRVAIRLGRWPAVFDEASPPLGLHDLSDAWSRMTNEAIGRKLRAFINAHRGEIAFTGTIEVKVAYVPPAGFAPHTPTIVVAVMAKSELDTGTRVGPMLAALLDRSPYHGHWTAELVRQEEERHGIVIAHVAHFKFSRPIDAAALEIMMREGALAEGNGARPGGKIVGAAGARAPRSGNGAARAVGGFRFEIGRNKKYKARKDVAMSIQNRLNAKRGLAQRIKAAKNWHRSSQGRAMHRDLGRYNATNPRAEGLAEGISVRKGSYKRAGLKPEKDGIIYGEVFGIPDWALAMGAWWPITHVPTGMLLTRVRERHDAEEIIVALLALPGVPWTTKNPADLMAPAHKEAVMKVIKAKSEARAEATKSVFWDQVLPRALFGELAEVAEDTHDRTVDDIFDALVRRLITIESVDVVQDVEFTDDGSIYLFFDPSLSGQEINEILLALQAEQPQTVLAGSPDTSLPGETAPCDWWVVFVRNPNAPPEEAPDTDVYALGPGAPAMPVSPAAANPMVKMAGTDLDRIVTGLDVPDLMKGLGGKPPKGDAALNEAQDPVVGRLIDALVAAGVPRADIAGPEDTYSAGARLDVNDLIVYVDFDGIAVAREKTGIFYKDRTARLDYIAELVARTRNPRQRPLSEAMRLRDVDRMAQLLGGRLLSSAGGTSTYVWKPGAEDIDKDGVLDMDATARIGASARQFADALARGGVGAEVRAKGDAVYHVTLKTPVAESSVPAWVEDGITGVMISPHPDDVPAVTAALARLGARVEKGPDGALIAHGAHARAVADAIKAAGVAVKLTEGEALKMSELEALARRYNGKRGRPLTRRGTGEVIGWKFVFEPRTSQRSDAEAFAARAWELGGDPDIIQDYLPGSGTTFIVAVKGKLAESLHEHESGTCCGPAPAVDPRLVTNESGRVLLFWAERGGRDPVLRGTAAGPAGATIPGLRERAVRGDGALFLIRAPGAPEARDTLKRWALAEAAPNVWTNDDGLRGFLAAAGGAK